MANILSRLTLYFVVLDWTVVVIWLSLTYSVIDLVNKKVVVGTATRLGLKLAKILATGDKC